MKKINDKVVENIVSSVLGIILFITFICVTLVIGIYAGIFKKSVLINNIYVSDYGKDVQESIYDECETIALSSSVPLESIDDVFEVTIVKHDINKYAEYAMDGKEYEVDTKVIEDKIHKNIDKYLTKENIVLNDEQKLNLDEYIEAIVEVYCNKIKIPGLEKFTEFKQVFYKVFGITIFISILLTTIIVLMLLKIQRWKHRALRYVSYSSIATAFSTILIPCIFLLSGKYKGANISEKYLYNLIVSTIQEFLKTYIYIGVFWIVFSVFIIMAITKLKNSSIDINKNKAKKKYIKEQELHKGAALD